MFFAVLEGVTGFEVVVVEHFGGEEPFALVRPEETVVSGAVGAVAEFVTEFAADFVDGHVAGELVGCRSGVLVFCETWWRSSGMILDPRKRAQYSHSF